MKENSRCDQPGLGLLRISSVLAGMGKKGGKSVEDLVTQVPE